MGKNLFIALAVLTGLAISMTACLLGDIEALQYKASENNLGVTVNIAEIRGVTVPATGEIPVRNIVDNDQYTGTVTWSPTPDSSGFIYQTKYTATITLTPKKGYTLHSVKANFFTVAGAESVNNTANSGIVTAVFPPANISKTINIASIQGVTIPAIGGVPVTTITENAQYGGIVTWNGNPSIFAGSNVYTATIILMPKPGYTLHGVEANFFTVAGAASVDNAADSGIVTAVFHETSKINVSISINAPVKGATPTTTASNNAENAGNFTIGPVTWSPSHNPFLGGMVYAASVTLTANSGYTFTGLSSATVNGQNAVVLNNTGSVVTLSYTFAETDTRTVTSIAIKTQPANMTYTHGDTLDLTGLVVTLTHDDNSTEDVASADFTAKNITATPAQGNNLVHSMHNGQPVKITYGNLTKNTNNLTVNKATHTTADFYVSGTGTFVYNGNSMAVTITPKDGTSAGRITVKYNGSITEPSTAGIYNVTFDVLETTNFNAAIGFSAGILTIEKGTPTATDFNVNGIGTFTYDGNPKIFTITPKTGKSDGTITVKYNGITNAPSAVGIYTVTFDVAETINFNAVGGFSAGTLTITLYPTFTNTYDLYIYLRDKPENTSSNPYNVVLNVDSADSHISWPIIRYVNLDLSGSTFTSIGDNAFRGCTGLTSVTIPDSVTSIGERAFSGCTGLTSVTIPNSVTSIGDNAFSGCTGLTSVTIPDSVTSIGWGAFSGCTGLTSVTIPDSVTSIGGYAFYDCTGLTSVTIPNSVTSIGERAFYGCTGLTSVTIPDSVTSIVGAFSGCTGLTSVTIPDSVTSIVGAFSGCTGLTSVTIPDSVTSIVSAFYGCTGLTSVTIGNSVTIIGDTTFSGCNNLRNITIKTDKVVMYSYNNWGKIFPATNLVVTFEDVTSINDHAFYGCTSLASVNIGNGVTSIGYNAFSGCTNLTSVNIGNGVTSIRLYAFYNCTSLASVTIGNGVTSIGDGAFNGTAWLDNQPEGLVYAGKLAYKYKGTMPVNTSIILLDGTKAIADRAFYECYGLTGITIPDSVTSIGRWAFYKCGNLNSVVIPNGVTSIGSGTFYQCTGLASVTIGNGVTSIGDEAFSTCLNLANVTIPDSVTSIGQQAFSSCRNFTSVTIPNSVTSIGSGAFERCTSLTAIIVNSNNINFSSDQGVLYNKNKTKLIQYPAGKDGIFTIPNNITSIEAWAFSGCSGLTGALTIPDSVTSIGLRTFFGCSGLTSVTIPDSVTSIEGLAFFSCTDLTSVTFEGPISSGNFASDAFDRLGDLRAKYLADGIGTYTTVRGSEVWTKQ